MKVPASDARRRPERKPKLPEHLRINYVLEAYPLNTNRSGKRQQRTNEGRSPKRPQRDVKASVTAAERLSASLLGPKPTMHDMGAGVVSWTNSVGPLEQAQEVLCTEEPARAQSTGTFEKAMLGVLCTEEPARAQSGSSFEKALLGALYAEEPARASSGQLLVRMSSVGGMPLLARAGSLAVLI